MSFKNKHLEIQIAEDVLALASLCEDAEAAGYEKAQAEIQSLRRELIKYKAALNHIMLLVDMSLDPSDRI